MPEMTSQSSKNGEKRITQLLRSAHEGRRLGGLQQLMCCGSGFSIQSSILKIDTSYCCADGWCVRKWSNTALLKSYSLDIFLPETAGRRRVRINYLSGIFDDVNDCAGSGGGDETTESIYKCDRKERSQTLCQ